MSGSECLTRFPQKPDESWMPRGKCRELGLNTNLFFPGHHEYGPTEQAIAVCASCEVKKECLEYACAFPCMDGVWGGTTLSVRKRMMRRRRTA